MTCHVTDLSGRAYEIVGHLLVHDSPGAGQVRRRCRHLVGMGVEGGNTLGKGLLSSRCAFILQHQKKNVQDLISAMMSEIYYHICTHNNLTKEMLNRARRMEEGII